MQEVQAGHEPFAKLSNTRGYAAIDQWKPLDVREFRSSWPVSAHTAAPRMSSVRSFFEFCRMPSNPARKVRNPRGRDTGDLRNEQKLPFTDAELQRMYEAAETQYGTHEVKWSRESDGRRVQFSYRRKNKWGGQDVADFISSRSIPGCAFRMCVCFTSTASSQTARSGCERQRPAPMLHLGSRMAPGAHTGARTYDRPIHLRRT